MKTKKQWINIIYNVLFYGLAFAIPIWIVYKAYKLLEIYPNGDKSLLTMDLWGQYFPMIVEQAHSSLSEKLYSWNGSLGFNSYTQSGYYCNSIFNIIYSLYKSNEDIIGVMMKVILMKFGLASLTCSIFLSYKYKRKNVFMLAGSVAYGVCSYAIAYLSQIMWFDSIIYLPIVLLGLERLVKSDKPLLYCLMLALTIFSSFYIGFSICIFLVIYFILLIAINEDNLKVKQIFKKFLKFALYSILAGGLTAFVLIPIYNTINQTIASEIAGPTEIKFYNSFADYIYSLFPDTKLSTEYYVPNIFTGDFIFIFIPLFFFNKGISFRKKISYGALLILLYFSMNFNYLDYVWHGFHFPNQLPGRWTFIFSLVCVIIFCECLHNFEKLSLKNIIVSYGVSLFLIYFARYTTNESYTSEQAQAMVKSMSIYVILIVLFYIFNRKKSSENFKLDFDNPQQIKETLHGNAKEMIFKLNAIPMVVLLVMSIYIVSGLKDNTVSVMKEYTNTSSVESYTSNDVVKRYINTFKSKDDDFYRMELNSGFTFNPAQLYNYKGISYYSSTMNGNVFNMFNQLGCRVYAQNVSTVYNNNSPILNSFFSVKYIMNRDKSWQYIGMTEQYKDDDYQVLLNDYWLPLAFHVNDDMQNLNLNNTIKPLVAQNMLVNKALGEDVDVFEIIDLDAPEITNATADVDNSNWDSSYYSTIDNSQPVNFKYSYTCTQDGYIYLQSNFRKGTLTYKVDGVKKTIDTGLERFKNLGYYETGDTIEINLEVEGVGYGLYGLELYYFNQEKMEYVYQNLSDEGIKIEKFENTKITGTIDMKSSGTVYTSIPNDNGWKVYCDGSKIRTFSIGDALIGFELPEGSHEIVFKYHVVGLGLGITISLVCLIVLIVLVLVSNGILDLKSFKIKKTVAKVEKSQKDTPQDNIIDGIEISFDGENQHEE